MAESMLGENSAAF